MYSINLNASLLIKYMYTSAVTLVAVTLKYQSTLLKIHENKNLYNNLNSLSSH